MNYEYRCHECKKGIAGETTGTYEEGDNITCPFCGNVMKIWSIEYHLFTKSIGEKVSPSEMEKLEQYRKKKQSDVKENNRPLVGGKK